MESQKYIEKVSASEMLDHYHNTHLESFMSSWINIQIFKGKDPKEKVGERVLPPMAEGQQPMKAPVSAKEALEREESQLKGQAEILVAVEARKQELSKLKDEAEIWQKI